MYNLKKSQSIPYKDISKLSTFTTLTTIKNTNDPNISYLCGGKLNLLDIVILKTSAGINVSTMLKDMELLSLFLKRVKSTETPSYLKKTLTSIKHVFSKRGENLNENLGYTVDYVRDDITPFLWNRLLVTTRYYLPLIIEFDVKKTFDSTLVINYLPEFSVETNSQTDTTMFTERKSRIRSSSHSRESLTKSKSNILINGRVDRFLEWNDLLNMDASTLIKLPMSNNIRKSISCDINIDFESSDSTTDDSPISDSSHTNNEQTDRIEPTKKSKHRKSNKKISKSKFSETEINEDIALNNKKNIDVDFYKHTFTIKSRDTHKKTMTFDSDNWSEIDEMIAMGFRIKNKK